MATIPNPPVEILIRNGSFIRRTYSEVDLGTQQSYLESLMTAKPAFIPGAFKTGNHPSHVCKVPQGELIVMTMLDALPMRTAFAIDNSDPRFLFPVFRIKPEAGEIAVKDNVFPWPSRIWGDLFFIETFMPNGLIHSPISCYLVVLREGEFYFPHYPNNYPSDGRMCMGHDWDVNKAGGFTILQEQYMHAYMSFFSTQLNDDLVTDNSYAMFSRMASEGNPWRVTDAEWAETIRPRSIVTARFLPQIGSFLTSQGYGRP